MPGFGRLVSIAVLLVGVPQIAFAQVAAPSAPTKGWSLDVAGTVGVIPGIGDTTTGVDLSGTVTVVRTSHSDDFRHRCLGLTAMLTGASHERSLLVGPRWDAGDPDGAVFVRILAGARRLDGPLPESNGQSESEWTPGVGAGVGMAVVGVLFDVNWITSPWAEHASQRLSVSVGYTWSFPFK